jgi:hypothetical protein
VVGYCGDRRVNEGKRLLFRTVGMLTKLVERFDSYRAREDEKPRDEDENDHGRIDTRLDRDQHEGRLEDYLSTHAPITKH